VSEAHCKEGVEAWNSIFVNGNPKGSIMVRLSKIELEQEKTETSLEKLQRAIEELPGRLAKTILLWLSIAVALIALIEFLGPSLRKTVGLALTHSTEIVAQADHERLDTFITLTAPNRR